MRKALIVLLVVAGVPLANSARAQEAPAPQPDATELAKKTQNPVGDLVTLPFQFNFNSGGGLEDGTFFNVNFQPVIPFKLTEHWSAISRTILPINSLPGADGQQVSGMGDIQEQLFITPARPGKIIWGIGPILSMPTATAPSLRTGTWAAGPTAVVLTMTGPWVLGGLISQAWPMSDVGGAPKADLFSLQPFVNYNFAKGYALSFSPIITANWDAPSGQEWTVPLGLGITRTVVFNRRPMNIGAQYYYNVERPDAGAGQTLRLIVALLYPTAKH